MAWLSYEINNKIEKFPLPPTVGPQRRVAIIGSRQGDQVLHLPGKPSIIDEHAIILEAKKISFFVIIDRSGGNTFINGSKVTGLKVLRHKDIITIGNINTQDRMDMVFYEVQIETLSTKTTCPTCERILNKGDRIVRCPKCGHIDKTKIFCRTCFLDSNFGKCKCGYTVQHVVNDILRTAEIKKILPSAKVDRLRMEKVIKGSELLREACPPFEDSNHSESRFQEEDEVVFCPQCEVPYHRGCWIRLKTCANPECSCNIEELIINIFSPAKTPGRVLSNKV